MKSPSYAARTALRFRRRVLKHARLPEAIAPYAPVGWIGALHRPGEEPRFLWGGQAVVGEKPVEKDTIFRVASISKMFGAAAALRLVKRGKLSLDDPASEVLGFDTTKPITLRQLITHTAALDDTALYDEVLGQPDAPTLEDLLKMSYFHYAPGTRGKYSNLGAGVVGMLVEAASGQFFDDFIRQEFFTPYGIDASFHPQRIVNKERMANCYEVPPGRLAYCAAEIAALPLDATPNPQRNYYIPAGKLMISAPDLLTAIEHLLKEDADMFVSQNRIGSVTCDAGRGLGAAVADGLFAPNRVFWGHQGNAYGALCEAWIEPSTGTAAVFLTNGVRMGRIGPLREAGQCGIAALLREG
ncbi:MAG: beta-lactamase family protein [Oscillospiraceae bacterium]|jgi:CubicO group peptidase (beta-lactamase class C family)|nr:beta-lactamase family protein [Oscillospiraceae bacterium]